MNIKPTTSLAAVLILSAAAASPVHAAMPGGSTVYAGLWSTNEDTPVYGIYSLGTDGPELKLADPKGSQIGYPMRSGWIADGKLCGYYVKESYSIVEEHYYIEVDASGATTRFDPLPDNCGYMFAATYNPDERCIYGYGLTGDYSYALLKAPADNPGNIQSVREFEWDSDEECLSIAYNTSDQKLYGVNARGKFVTIDKTSGIQKIIADTPDGTDGIISGMCYSPKEDLMYWNPQFTDGSSAIYTVTADGSQFTRIYTCANNEQYNFMICPDKAATAESPEAPVIKSVNFAGGSTSGSFVLTLPAATVGSQPLEGQIGWQALLDGEQVSEGTGTAGADVTVNFSNLAEGNHIFTFRALAGGAVSENTSRPMWVGVDTPAPTAKVTLTHDRVIWEPVNSGINGGWIDLDNLEYEVLLNGDHAFSQPASALYGYHQLSSAELKRYTASVIVKAGGKSSAATHSNELALGTPLQPSFTLVPDRDDVEKMSVIDANGDGRTWSYSIYQECAKSSFGSGIPMDDWLILSPVEFKKETSYTLSIDVQTCSSTYLDESMRVCIADTPDPAAMTRILIPTFKPERAINTWKADFTLPADGTYYIGFHTDSAPDQEGILLSNISLHRTGESAITDTETNDADTPAEYFTLQGIRVDAPASGLYIVRRGARVTKVLLP